MIEIPSAVAESSKKRLHWLYCTATVTGGLLCPATVTTRGASPEVTPEGTMAFTW